jgi:outer membrane biosynthesis protein TonB
MVPPPPPPPRATGTAPSGGSKGKGLIIAIVLAVGFVLLIGTAVVGYVAWRFYAARQAAQMASDVPAMPDGVPVEPTPEYSPEEMATPEGEPPVEDPAAAIAEATEEPTPEATSEPEAEAASEPTAAPTRKPTRAKTPKPATAEPTDAPTAKPEKREPPKARAYDIGHMHGGLKKKMCSGTIELNDTGFKYVGTTSEDDRVDQAEYRFDQVKKVEMKDAKTVEVSTVDKKWTFRGDGLTVAKIKTHLDMRSSEFAGK